MLVYQRFIVDFPENQEPFFVCHFLRGKVWRQGAAGEVSATKFKGDSFGQSCDDGPETAILLMRNLGQLRLHMDITMVINPHKLEHRPWDCTSKKYTSW